jgi:hypothetical protein
MEILDWRLAEWRENRADDLVVAFVITFAFAFPSAWALALALELALLVFSLQPSIDGRSSGAPCSSASSAIVDGASTGAVHGLGWGVPSW